MELVKCNMNTRSVGLGVCVVGKLAGAVSFGRRLLLMSESKYVDLLRLHLLQVKLVFCRERCFVVLAAVTRASVTTCPVRGSILVTQWPASGRLNRALYIHRALTECFIVFSFLKETCWQYLLNVVIIVTCSWSQDILHVVNRWMSGSFHVDMRGGVEGSCWRWIWNCNQHLVDGNESLNLCYEILTAVKIQVTDFWVVTPCSNVVMFRSTMLPSSLRCICMYITHSTLKTETAWSSGTLVPSYHISSWRHKPDDRDLNFCCCMCDCSPWKPLGMLVPILVACSALSAIFILQFKEFVVWC
jgi:hypothetical protein